MTDTKNYLLGNLEFSKESFDEIEIICGDYSSAEFKNKNSIQRNKIINDNLIKFIQQTSNTFCLSSVVNYLEFISKKYLLDGPYNLTAFERYLNQESPLSDDEKYLIRAKIIGKHIPREEYQSFFPVGRGERHYGTHTVTAHNPPDLDSTTASFVSWLDAFGCHVSNSLTVWNVPQGRPSKLISSFFDQLFPEAIFTRIAKERSFISTVAMDIVEQTNLYRAQLTDNIRKLSHNSLKTHIIAIDKEGYYCGDWRVSDNDAIGTIQRYLNMWFYFYEKEFIDKFFNLFANEEVYFDDVKKIIDNILNKKILQLDLFADQYSEKESNILDRYLQLILNVEKGCQTSKRQLLESFDNISTTNFCNFCQQITNLLDKKNYCNNKINLTRNQIFAKLQKAYKILIISSTIFRNYTEQLQIALKIKSEMLNLKTQYVTTKSLVSEVKQLIEQTQYSHITVNYSDIKGNLIPVGFLQRENIYRPFLGTVSLRDFSNRDEIKLGNDIKVISIIDHHRSELSSSTVATIKIEDVQSCNILLARQAFLINDTYPKTARTLQQINNELAALNGLDDELQQMRLQTRLITEKQAFLKNNKYFIDSQRELKEYLLFLNAIIDDTDLLAKAGWRDLYTIAELLNRIKSLQLQKTVEIINISTEEPIQSNLPKARQHILSNDDMYSFYKKIYQKRELIINEIIEQSKNETCQYFVDRKIQQSCCSVSQFKLFSNNWKTLLKNRNQIINKWIDLNKTTHQKISEVDFFLQMNSTICSYTEAYNGSLPNSGNTDEIWLSVDQKSNSAIARLVQFTKLIMTSPKDINLKIFVEGHNDEWGQTLLRSLDDQKTTQATFKQNNNISETIVTLTFKQASLNSRKADITPNLPH